MMVIRSRCLKSARIPQPCKSFFPERNLLQIIFGKKSSLSDYIPNRIIPLFRIHLTRIPASLRRYRQWESGPEPLHSPMPIRPLYSPGFPVFASARINFVQNPPIFVHGFLELDDLTCSTPIGVIKSDFFVPYYCYIIWPISGLIGLWQGQMKGRPFLLVTLTSERGFLRRRKCALWEPPS